VEVELVKGKGKEKEKETLSLEDIIDVKGWKALGNRLSEPFSTLSRLTPGVERWLACSRP
jgi:topoisomerase-4 subunit A